MHDAIELEQEEDKQIPLYKGSTFENRFCNKLEDNLLTVPSFSPEKRRVIVEPAHSKCEHELGTDTLTREEKVFR